MTRTRRLGIEPLIRTRRDFRLRDHLVQVLLDPGADLLRDGLHQRLVVDGVGAAELDRVDRLEEADLELRRQVAEHPQRPEPGEGRRDREVDQPGEPLQRRDLGEDRRRLLGPDDADRHQLRLGAHRRLDEAAAAEAPQPVAVLVELLGPLAALGEDEHELALVVEQPVDVRRVGGDAADLRDQHREARDSP